MVTIHDLAALDRMFCFRCSSRWLIPCLLQTCRHAQKLLLADVSSSTGLLNCREEEAVNEAELSPEDFLDKQQRVREMREQVLLHCRQCIAHMQLFPPVVMLGQDADRPRIVRSELFAVGLQNDALVAQMEGMSHEEQQQFLAQQVTERVRK